MTLTIPINITIDDEVLRMRFRDGLAEILADELGAARAANLQAAKPAEDPAKRELAEKIAQSPKVADIMDKLHLQTIISDEAIVDAINDTIKRECELHTDLPQAREMLTKAIMEAARLMGAKKPTLIDGSLREKFVKGLKTMAITHDRKRGAAEVTCVLLNNSPIDKVVDDLPFATK